MLTLILILVLAACGGGAEKNNTNGNSAKNGNNAANGNAQSGDETGTVVYKAANGDVEIPKNPKRIVLLADYFGYFQQLGIKPVGVSNYSFQNPFYEGLLDGVENLGDGKSAEKILALQPDLILTWDPNSVEAMKKIAPTVLIEFGKLNYKEQLREFGRMTGTLDQAEAWLTSWETKIAEVKPKVQEAVGDKTISIMQIDAKNVYVFGDKFGRGGEIIYGELGLNSTALTKAETIDKGPGYATVSLEKVPDFAGDYMFTSSWSMEKDGSEVYNTPVWKNLPAVKSGNVFNIHPIGYYFNDPISMEGQLKFIVESLTGQPM
ncbi:iron(3+)-hydroxamate-binding protein fhuD [Paenibacillus swuensis]|uniref:Iron(3+)-hydroxamate-binding protein fhuD n=1 Tax=Paenibacillus swuensis TaxID=1178515 RepID=A0A172TNY2_9BACL|nr:iron(3+)-hydroxamate-binding protein fhuD [Paenibacillus swuensis]